MRDMPSLTGLHSVACADHVQHLHQHHPHGDFLAHLFAISPVLGVLAVTALIGAGLVFVVMKVTAHDQRNLPRR